MQAVVFETYGSPDVMQIKEIEKPTPKDNEVLVKIHASSVNAADWHLLHGTPAFFRLIEFGFPKPKITIIGGDVAGTVEAVGSAVTRFKPGDAVFGDASLAGFGAFAEYKAVPEELLVLKPANVTFEQAAAVPLAALTALQALRYAGEVGPGTKVLVNGATGGVGLFTVQIAKAYGAEVTGVCNPKKVETVRAAGADHVIDYASEDFTRSGQQYDVIIDIAASRTAAEYKRALSPTGRYVMCGFSGMGHLIGLNLRGMWITRTTDKKFGMMGTAQPNQDDLQILREMVESGKIVPHIDQTYPLSGVPDAIKLMESRQIHGKVVISVVSDD